MVREKEHLEKMKKVYEEICNCTSWKRKNDLRRQLAKLEKEWETYNKLKRQ
jgi:hypothetical protein